MIPAEERQHLEELRSQTTCLKKYACMYSSLADLCQARYHSDRDVLECLKGCKPTCNFCCWYGAMLICTCPLRKYIAVHFEKWAAEETFLLTPDPDPALSGKV